jgi:hypothetical protein
MLLLDPPPHPVIPKTQNNPINTRQHLALRLVTLSKETPSSIANSGKADFDALALTVVEVETFTVKLEVIPLVSAIEPGCTEQFAAWGAPVHDNCRVSVIPAAATACN